MRATEASSTSQASIWSKSQPMQSYNDSSIIASTPAKNIVQHKIEGVVPKGFMQVTCRRNRAQPLPQRHHHGYHTLVVLYSNLNV